MSTQISLDGGTLFIVYYVHNIFLKKISMFEKKKNTVSLKRIEYKKENKWL